MKRKLIAWAFTAILIIEGTQCARASHPVWAQQYNAAEAQQTAPASKEQKNSTPASKEQKNSAPAAEEQKNSASASKEQKNSTPAAEEQKNSAPASDAQKNSAPAAEEQKNSAPASDAQKNSTPASKEQKNSAPASKEQKNSAPAAEEQKNSTPASKAQQNSAPAAEEQKNSAPASDAQMQEQIYAKEAKENEPELVVMEDQTGALPSYEREQTASYTQEILPQVEGISHYDAREEGLITPVKQQGEDNTCWAFSAISLAETSMIRQGIVTDGQVATKENTDLSEWQLAYFVYHHGVDEYGNTAGDKTTLRLGNSRTAGGNNVFTTFALANWTGVADEKTVPYSESGKALAPALEYEDVAHLQKAYWIRFQDTEGVKAAIRECGSVTINYYHHESYMNYTNQSYFYNGTKTSVNHTITLIGWDDNYPKEKFNENARPQNNGAWLVKNSWGTEWPRSGLGEDGGYFWISYEDTNFVKDTAKCFAYQFESADNYDHNYQYDGTAGAYISSATQNTKTAVANGESLADIYRVPVDSKGEDLEAVSFALYDMNVSYSIQVYGNVQDMQDPTSGEPLLQQPVTGNTTFLGYYTVPLGQSLPLDPGEHFSVVITLTSADGQPIYYFSDRTYSNGNWLSFYSQTDPGQSFYHDPQRGWVDLHEEGVCARVKAFTKDRKVKTYKLELSGDKSAYYLYEKKAALSARLYELQEGKEKQEQEIEKITYTSSDTTVVTVNTKGELSFKSAGQATITAGAQINGQTIEQSCTIKVRQHVTDITLKKEEISLKTSHRYTIQSTVSPSNAYKKTLRYESLDPKIVSVDAQGNLTAKKVGTAEILISAADGSDTSTICFVTVKKNTAKQVSGAESSGGAGKRPVKKKVQKKSDLAGSTMRAEATLKKENLPEQSVTSTEAQKADQNINRTTESGTTSIQKTEALSRQPDTGDHNDLSIAWYSLFLGGACLLLAYRKRPQA